MYTVAGPAGHKVRCEKDGEGGEEETGTMPKKRRVKRSVRVGGDEREREQERAGKKEREGGEGEKRSEISI